MVTGERLRFLGPGTAVAVVVTTAVSTFPVLVEQPALRLPLGLLSVVMVTWALVGLWVVDFRHPPSWAPDVMVLGYASFAFASLWLSRGGTFVVVMPVVSIAVLYLSFPRALALSLALSVVASLSATNDLWAAVLHLARTSAAMIFVFVFSLIARRERFARRELERLSGQVAELATERERSRLARELHDSLGHALTVAHVQLEAARGDPVNQKARIVQAQTLLADGLRELRRTVGQLREKAPLALQAALQELATESRATGLVTEVVLSGVPRPLSADQSFALFRAAQEGLTNVHRHTRASRVVLTLTYGTKEVSLEVTDDGVTSGTVVHGNGLRGLEERVSTLGGRLRAEPRPGAGFSLCVEVPA